MYESRLNLTRWPAGRIRRPACAVLICFIAMVCSLKAATAQVEIPIGPRLSLTPADLPGGVTVPGLYTWYSSLGITSNGWLGGETVNFHLYGPLNTMGVMPVDHLIGYATADSTGTLGQFYTYAFGGAVKADNLYLAEDIPDQPYSLTETFPEGYVPRPGQYQLQAIGTAPKSGIVIRPDGAYANLNICPDTISRVSAVPVIPFYYGWSQYRGGRDGFLGDNSPERSDPEWPSVWSETPVGIYATIASPADASGITDPPANQPSFVSHADLPFTHYGHDVNMELLPDPDCQWILGTANWSSDTEEGKVNFGSIECEWEIQNNGNPNTYGTGVIGMPTWVMPTAGDRVYMVGRWVMDNGHPDGGDRTEIHPPRLLATMRKRYTAVPFLGASYRTRASQVDIYVSGHGGGCNQFPDELSETIDRDGEGGGILQSLNTPLTGLDLDNYYAQGPASGDLVDVFIDIYQFLKGDQKVQANAGPSALGWTAGPEERPINTMDYDFDVPLPPAPPGATAPRVLITAHPTGEDTAVREQITYTNVNVATGLPTTAHIHLPYKGADNRIYAKTLNFYWDAFSPPGAHFQVQMDDIVFFLASAWSGKCQMWTDVCGQWQYLTAIDPQDFLNAGVTQHGYLLNSPPIDVYLEPTDKLRVFTMGYDQEAFDGDFGAILGEPPDNPLTSYEAGLPLALQTAVADLANKLSGNHSAENINLGGALFEGTPSSQNQAGTVGGHITDSDTANFYEHFTVNYIPRPPALGVFGAPTDFGEVCLNTATPVYRDVSVINKGEAPLTITGVSVSGAGYSVIPGLPTPFNVTGGQAIDLNLYFKPTSINDGSGTLTIQSNDPLQPSVTYNLSASVGHPIIRASANTGRTPSLVVGTTTTWPVTLFNPGACPLTVRPFITGTGFSLVLPKNPFGFPENPISVPPGGTNGLTVVFTAPSVATKFVGTLTLTSNDPITPTTQLVFGAEGVPVGMRVLVVGADGTPYPVVDDIQLLNPSKKVNMHLREAPLTTIDPPASWQRIQYDYMTALPPTDDGSAYELRVQVGHMKKSLTFALAPDEFKQLVVSLP